jgi:nucleoside transporter
LIKETDLPNSISVRLAIMMFLNFVVWGCWYVTITTYLTATLHFSGTQAGAVFGTTALASIISPFFVGLIADRFFSTERVLSALHLIGAVFLYLVTTVHSFGAVYGLMFAYCLCYFPTIALTTSITLKNCPDARRFPLFRVFGTLGWIVIGYIVGHLKIEASSSQFLLASGTSIVMALFSLTLPHTPPAGKGKAITARDVLGLDALVMLKDRSYLIFAVTSVFACIPLTFYFSFTNAYLNDVGLVNAAGKMTLGQVSEVGMMLAMPFVFRRMNVKSVLLLGLAAWSLRYALLGFGNAGPLVWMFYVAIIVHGVCYDFFFVTGQLYTDQEAPSSLRNTAQGFYTFLTYGLGMFMGSLLSGIAVDFFTTGSGANLHRNWNGFWLSSSAAALLLFLAIALLFRGNTMIRSKQREMVEELV